MFSVLIPIYNGIEFLDESLTSVINQTFKNWEVIIGINGHDINSEVEEKAKCTVSVLGNDVHDIRVIYYDTKGKSATLNAMLKDCKYEYIALLDVDDIWLPNKLEKQAQYVANYDVVGTDCQYFGTRNDKTFIPCGDISEFNFLSSNPVINCSAIIKKELCYWDTCIFSGVEDYDMWLRLRYEKRKFFNIPEILCLHRLHPISNFNNSNNNYVEALKHKWINISLKRFTPLKIKNGTKLKKILYIN